MSKIISAVTIANLIEAHMDKDEQRFLNWANYIADAYEENGETSKAKLIRRRISGEYKNSPVAVLDEIG